MAAGEEGCVEGGHALQIGLDDGAGEGGAGDGALRADEIDHTLSLCHGGGGAWALLEVNAEPGCPEGGARVDADGDGALSEGEITTTSYVCQAAAGADGQPGADGARGAATLIEARDESPGDHCAYGGLKVVTGVDADGDRILNEDEIENTRYVCHGEAGPQGSEGGCTISRGGAAPRSSQLLALIGLLALRGSARSRRRAG